MNGAEAAIAQSIRRGATVLKKSIACASWLAGYLGKSEKLTIANLLAQAAELTGTYSLLTSRTAPRHPRRPRLPEPRERVGWGGRAGRGQRAERVHEHLHRLARGGGRTGTHELVAPLAKVRHQRERVGVALHRLAGHLVDVRPGGQVATHLPLHPGD